MSTDNLGRRDRCAVPGMELRQEYQDLEGRLWSLDRRLADALNRIKHTSTEAFGASSARREGSPDATRSPDDENESNRGSASTDCQEGKATLSYALRGISVPKPTR